MIERGANYPKQPRDFFPTPRAPVASLLRTIQFRKEKLCDPCCGTGVMLNVFREFGYNAVGFDIDPWLSASITKLDFLVDPFPKFFGPCDIVTNPPYGVQGRKAIEFIDRSLEVTLYWHGKVAMLLPMDFDSAKTRVRLFRDCPAFVCKLVLLNRIKWFDDTAGSVNHAWFIWDWNYSHYRAKHSVFKAPIIKYVE